MNWGLGGWNDPQRGLRKMVRRLELENSILIGRDVFHHVAQGGPAVAWSIGDDIYFNGKQLPSPDTREDIIFVTGVNKHELAHVLFTPTPADIRMLWPSNRVRVGADPEMVVSLQKKPYQAAFNILEDQRIEMLLAKRYANVRPYLIAAFTRIILNSTAPGMLDVAYLYARGRRYLPVKVRRLLKRRFKNQALVPEIRRIIDAYVRLNLFVPADLMTAHRLVLQFEQLMVTNGVLDNTGMEELPDFDQCKSVAQLVDGQHESERQISGEKVTAQEATHVGNADPKDIEKASQAVADDVDADAAGQGKGDDAEDATGDPDGSSEGSTQGEEGEEGEQGSPGAGSGLGSGRERIDNDSIAEVLSGLLVGVLDSEDVQREVSEVRTFIRTQRDFDTPQIREWGPVPDDLPVVARKIANNLRKIEVDADPYWERRTNSGRLNVQRLMQNPDDRDHAFDQWRDGGMGGNDQEWVILVDCSGSMDSVFSHLSKASWAMKKAGDIIRATVTIIAYGSANCHRAIYKPTDRATGTQLPSMPELGGTQPGSALLQAHRTLLESRKAQKGLIVMTDGDWGGEYQGVLTDTPFSSADAIIDDLSKRGVMTHLVFLGGYYGRLNMHGCKTGGRIKTVDDMPDVMKDLMASRIVKVQ